MFSKRLGVVSLGTRPCIMAYLTDSSRPIDMKLYGVFMGLFVVVGQSLGPAIGEGWNHSITDQDLILLWLSP